jgi:hypothetical protein
MAVHLAAASPIEKDEQMTPQEAVKAIDEVRSKNHTPQKHRVLRGLQVLAKYDDTLEMSFEHDQCWVGDFEATVAKMTVEDVGELAVCGWFEDLDSWSHY